MNPCQPVLLALCVVLGFSASQARGAGTNALGLPAFRYHGVVLRAQDLRYKPHDDIIYPSVVRIKGRVGQPLGAYYMYYAPHDAPGGICLAYADRPEGPWREHAQNPLISRSWSNHFNVSHVSGPDALWSESERRLLLYFHGENDTTRLATSEDGVAFRYEGVCITTGMFPNVSEASYGRVFQHRLPGEGNRYVMLLMGNNQGTRRIYLASSEDGRKWKPRAAPLIDPPPGTDQIAGAVYLRHGGKHFLIFHGNNSKAAFNEGFDLYAAETDESFSRVRHLGKFMDHRFVSPTNPAVMSPCFLEDDGRLYLYFNIGARLKNQIALAVEE